MGEFCEAHGAVSEKITHLEKQFDKMEGQTKAIIEMGMSIQHMADQVQEMVTMLKNHNDRIECLERAPGDNLKSKWQDVTKALIACAVTLFLRYLITGGW